MPGQRDSCDGADGAGADETTEKLAAATVTKVENAITVEMTRQRRANGNQDSTLDRQRIVFINYTRVNEAV